MKKILFLLGFTSLIFCSCSKSVKIDSIKTKGIVVKEYVTHENGNPHYIIGIQNHSDIVETEVSYTIFDLVNPSDSIK